MNNTIIQDGVLIVENRLQVSQEQVYIQLIASDETLTTNTISLNTGVHRLVDIYATATTATTFTVDISMDNTNWVNYYTSAATEAKYTSTIWSGFRYVKLSAAVAGVSGTDTTTLIVGSKQLNTCDCADIAGKLDEIIEMLMLLNTTKKRKKRKPSKYNIFIGSCMKEDGKDMKQCAKEYDKTKNGGQL